MNPSVSCKFFVSKTQYGLETVMVLPLQLPRFTIHGLTPVGFLQPGSSCLSLLTV